MVIQCEEHENDVRILKKYFRFETWREIQILKCQYKNATKINVSIYQSIGNDETNLMMCSLLKFDAGVEI